MTDTPTAENWLPPVPEDAPELVEHAVFRAHTPVVEEHDEAVFRAETPVEPTTPVGEPAEIPN